MHTLVHLNWSEADNASFSFLGSSTLHYCLRNRTLISHAGSLLHIGQFFFDKTWNDQVYATSPYSEDTNDRTLNHGG